MHACVVKAVSMETLCVHVQINSCKEKHRMVKTNIERLKKHRKIHRKDMID